MTSTVKPTNDAKLPMDSNTEAETEEIDPIVISEIDPSSSNGTPVLDESNSKVVAPPTALPDSVAPSITAHLVFREGLDVVLLTLTTEDEEGPFLHPKLIKRSELGHVINTLYEEFAPKAKDHFVQTASVKAAKTRENAAAVKPSVSEAKRTIKPASAKHFAGINNSQPAPTSQGAFSF